MTLSRPAGAAVAVAPAVDLRRAPLADLQSIDFRGDGRDFWADEAAIWDRLVASWAGLDDAAWRLPGAAKSDAGGPDWSLLEHVCHILDWLEIAETYIGRALATGEWPADDDFAGGDFDRFNESRRERYVPLTPAGLRRQLSQAREKLLAMARRLDETTIRSDLAWGWVYLVFHGHDIDHLRVIEPWTDALRARQIGNDPFVDPPQLTAPTLAAMQAVFWADEASVTDLFRETVLALPDRAWTTTEVTPGWTTADHVGHLAAWCDEAAAAIEAHAPGAPWRPLPAQGVDAWNAADIAHRRGTPPAELREDFERARERLVAAVRAMPDEDWLDPEGYGWAYEDLHGHVRAHLAMVAPFAARVGWPPGDGA